MIFLAATLLAGCGDTHPPSLPVDLRIELLRGDNVTLNTTIPRFGWAMTGDHLGARQTAYRIVVDTSLQTRGNAWDSGKVGSSTSAGVSYAGQPLVSGTRYYWRVMLWDETGTESGFSEARSFRVDDLAAAMPSRMPLVANDVAPTSVLQLAPDHVFITFPAVSYGTIAIDFDAVHDAVPLQITIGEHRIGNAVWRSAADGFTPEIGLATHSATLNTNGRPGRQLLMLPAIASEGAAGLPDGIEGILPFRFVEVVGDSAVLRAAKFVQVVVTYPSTDIASFHSSDPVLDAVWELSSRTMLSTSAFGLFVDGNRERLAYEADAYINQLGHYQVTADYSLARFTAAHLLRHPTWPTEWILHDVRIAWADYLYTGDDRFLREHYDELVRTALLELARDDGLISTTGGRVTPSLQSSLRMTLGPIDIVDWPPVERDGYDMAVEYNTVVNLFHCDALKTLAMIAAAIGRESDARAFEARYDRVRLTIQSRLIDPATGLFVDGEGSLHTSLHANLFALAFDLVPEQNLPAVLAYVESRGMATSVYGAQYLLEGLYRRGAGVYALSLLTSRGTRSWAHMIYDLGATLTHEAWDPSIKPNEDWNHAWGAAPANIIPRWTMGVRPLEPGFAVFLVAPQIGALDWAELNLPTGRGTIDLRVEKKQKLRIVDLTVPANSAAVVEPPCGGNGREALVDGKAVSLAGTGLRLPPLTAGRHRIVCEVQ